MFRVTSGLVTLAGIFAWSMNMRADVVIETVTVGNPGNPGELSGDCVPDGGGPCRECGAVDYVYNIGKFEVTAGQYTEFLNAVAATDRYGLYHGWMWSWEYGCKIERTGSSGSYTYSVAGDWADRPVNFVSWGDAARFANWLHNGQPGIVEPGVYDPVPQDENSTEDGSYDLSATHEYYGPDGETIDPDGLLDALIAVEREPDATWVIPSEDEWYKAAYHYNDGATGNYYDYPTGGDSLPDNDVIDPDPGNNANYRIGLDDDTIGSPYWRTDVGEFENSKSAYGTFDQCGNVWEWNEAVVGLSRGMRSGAYRSNYQSLHAAGRFYFNPADEYSDAGFRVAEVTPLIPTVSEWGLLTMTLLVLAAGTVMLRRRRRVACN